MKWRILVFYHKVLYWLYKLQWASGVYASQWVATNDEQTAPLLTGEQRVE